MDADVLNRVGILCNLLAGFLLAPQLIGLHRIRNAERWAERQSHRLHGIAGRHAEDLRVREPSAATEFDAMGPPNFEMSSPWEWVRSAVYPLLALAAIAGTWVGVYRLSGSGGVVAILVATAGTVAMILLPFALFAALPSSDSKPVKIVWVLLVACMMWPLALLVFVVNTPRVFAYSAMRTLEFTASVTRRWLEADDRLLGLLTLLGVLTFVGGNALQFVATYAA